jgi:hypothetical protein
MLALVIFLLSIIAVLSFTSPRSSTLQRQNAENMKQIFPEKEYINGIAVAV